MRKCSTTELSLAPMFCRCKTQPCINLGLAPLSYAAALHAKPAGRCPVIAVCDTDEEPRTPDCVELGGPLWAGHHVAVLQDLGQRVQRVVQAVVGRLGQLRVRGL